MIFFVSVSVMLEGSAEKVPYDIFATCMKEGVAHAQQICDVIAALQQEHGKKKRECSKVESCNDDQVTSLVREKCADQIRKIYTDYSHDKVLLKAIE